MIFLKLLIGKEASQTFQSSIGHTSNYVSSMNRSCTRLMATRPLKRIPRTASIPKRTIDAASPETLPQPRKFASKRGGAPFLIMGIATVLIASLASYEIGMESRRRLAYENRIKNDQILCTDNWDSTEHYDRLAKNWDKEVSQTEFWTGISLWRWWLTRQLRGKVLEVCAGTGGNIPYYNFKKIKEIHFLDQSDEMIRMCKLKWEKGGDSNVPASFFASSIEHFPLPDEKYDAVIQTAGLCSVADPVVVLKKMQQFVKPGGKIYLIEHGRGSYKWINDRLDTQWEYHAEKYGCIMNRSISKIIKESGLVVESRFRWLFGTIWIIIGRPPRIEDEL
jgi:ubiquinone/menaquinone biosynthesis C-methylase UbiE